MQRVKRSAERMSRILSDLLDLASIDAGHVSVELERLPVAQVLEDALEQSVLAATRKGVALALDAPPPLISDVLCDRERLLQVFGNLVGNAIKFTPAGGSIRLRAEAGRGEVLFTVADTGPGIPEDELPRLFDRYWQAKSTARLGTGLGLSIARGLVEAQRGRMWAESRPGVGSTFSFTIPCAPPAAQA